MTLWIGKDCLTCNVKHTIRIDVHRYGGMSSMHTRMMEQDGVPTSVYHVLAHTAQLVLLGGTCAWRLLLASLRDHGSHLRVRVQRDGYRASSIRVGYEDHIPAEIVQRHLPILHDFAWYVRRCMSVPHVSVMLRQDAAGKRTLDLALPGLTWYPVQIPLNHVRLLLLQQVSGKAGPRGEERWMLLQPLPSTPPRRRRKFDILETYTRKSTKHVVRKAYKAKLYLQW